MRGGACFILGWLQNVYAAGSMQTGTLRMADTARGWSALGKIADGEQAVDWD